jgi:high affinity Mn2+ porin
LKTLTLLVFLLPISAIAREQNDTTKSNVWTLHFQQTVIGQYHPNFHATDIGKNTQVSSGEPQRVSITSTIFIGRKLWKGAELYFNPELSGGRGLGSTIGVAGFPNGETYRIGNAEPVVALVRLYLRQTFNLGRTDMSPNSDGQNQIAGQVPSKRIVVTLGKFSVTDIFDNNTYSHDARSQFMNWALMSAGAWDYPADTKGYTWGGVAEWINPAWSLKAGITMVPTVANGPNFDNNITKANSISLEYDHNFTIAKRPGVLRLIGYYTNAHMGNYKLATDDTIYHKDITATRAYGRTKLGFVINAEQEISDNAGVFGRISYNDGLNETWAFTEIDRSVALGIVFKGIGWKRPDDRFGAAIVVNGLSNDHRAYLASGGYGFIIGDGALDYGYETVLETYYNFKINNNLWVAPDYQFVLNPAYNKANGPIHFFGVRAHVEF